MEWFSWVVAVILLISSVISPWLVNKENNKHQLDLKKLDIYEDAKRKALIEFIECTEDYSINYYLVEQNIKFHSAVNKLFIYFSDINKETFSELEKSITSNNTKDTSNELTKIVQVLSEQIKKE
ncbi:MAG: hypothetical protein ACI4ON_00295 [Clostridia bacterium]